MTPPSSGAPSTDLSDLSATIADRRAQVGIRVLFYAGLGIVTALLFRAPLAVIALGLLAVADVWASHAWTRVLRRAGPGGPGRDGVVNRLLWISMPGSVALSLYVIALWPHEPEGAHIFALSILAAAAIYATIKAHRLRGLLVFKVGAIVALGLGLCVAEVIATGMARTSIVQLAGVTCFVMVLGLCAAQFTRLHRAHCRREVELALAREAAERAMAMRTHFLARVGHELRTPLNGILGMAELLGRSGLGTAQAAQLRVIEGSGRTLARLLDDMLDQSRLEAGMLTVAHEPGALGELALDCAALFSPLATRKGLELDVRIDASMPETLLLDPLRVRQCLCNLLSNAIKFTSRGTVTLEVGFDPAAGLAMLCVSDTGIGIAPENFDRIFEPFAQEHSDTARDFGGTGLGLSITRDLARLMGGSLEVESAPGVGARFTLRFAAAPGPAREAQPAHRPVLRTAFARASSA